MEPQIRYVKSADGTNIAYIVMGDGVPLIFSPNIWTHLTLTMTGATLEASQRMAEAGMLFVRYDMRGMGMSDRDVEDFSLESQMADIEALRRHMGFDRFALWGKIQGSLVCIAYAAAHPERLTHLILSTPFASGEDFYRAWPTFQGLESFRALGDEQWELYTLMHATAVAALIPGSDPRRMAHLMRECTTADVLRRYLSTLRNQDVSSLLRDVRLPTFVFNPQFPQGPREQERLSRAVAADIPGARLVNVEAHFDMLSLTEAQLATEFVLGRAVEWPSPADADTSRSPASSGTAIILFADIVDSTALTERLGDAAFRDKARDLDTALRGVIRDNAGTAIEGKLLGDGVLAVFTSARQAIEAALACATSGASAGLPLHLGVHAGDVIREENNVYGGAVNIASRISGLSAPGEVLVSDTVRSLARTSAGATFEDRGEHSLKGVGEPVRVWAIHDSSDSEIRKEGQG